jgi:hypothetical protein
MSKQNGFTTNQNNVTVSVSVVGLMLLALPSLLVSLLSNVPMSAYGWLQVCPREGAHA